MNTKEETVRHMTRRLKRIINKHMRIEKLPIPVGETLLLSPSEVHSIQTIGNNKGININTLGQLMGITRSAASQMVGKLMKKGLIEKRSATNNKKETLAFLTDSGWEAFKIHEEFHERHLNDLLNQLDEFSDTQIATTSTILSVIEDIMNKRMAELFDI
ncbi:MarR family winged helix-turn-helix transcriptional regulator [Maridesulfovibrio ferrireducens]|uniref:MarR family winged helix-turn-helix transcriptional regulator n=1 Tax=Maridesulfovibrio ferrireducens TaxID=246191 RepID=UPI001A2A5F6E|nr:MarR family transcriptional regulator [Maridesulfovibrio ferrireducens]MBI9113127.1 MarR family transcriptional regulator [Maridesulfovibrio ferrireducens]